MNAAQSIRQRLGMSQAAFAHALGVSQGNICHIEQQRQEVTPRIARRIIALAAKNGIAITFDDIYAAAPEERHGANQQTQGRLND
ncbi:helix-turn-helix domain-containing protein [Azonexus sp.]|uniref:helix-turn-helix domain-containing protein n=1 Tax=Azonexus sp. TaxID=1872668 RepID=UPI0039E37608